MQLTEFNHAEPARVQALLTECVDVSRWVDAVLGGRPYDDLAELVAAAEAALPLQTGEIRKAMAAHPRIGEKAAGWSASEQSGVDDVAAAEFRKANAEYEERFGHVFLVCASGRGGEELLANLRSRLDNDPETELAVAGEELGKIAILRLKKAVTR